MDNNDQQIITATQNWLKTVIIAYGICPFAKRELDRGSIRFCTDHATEVESCLLNLLLECDRLNIDSSIETTLLIYDCAFSAFDDYLDYLALAGSLLIKQGYEGVYQLASFHPDYCFEGSTQTDPANYTNRSPYPILHLLRETSIDRAIATYPNPENIPQRNIELTRELGLAKMQALLAQCYPYKNNK
jgi:hypothetical protein